MNSVVVMRWVKSVQEQMLGAHATVIGHLLFTPAAQGAFEPHAGKN